MKTARDNEGYDPLEDKDTEREPTDALRALEGLVKLLGSSTHPNLEVRAQLGHAANLLNDILPVVRTLISEAVGDEAASWVALCKWPLSASSDTRNMLLAKLCEQAVGGAFEACAKIADQFPTYRRDDQSKGSRVADEIRAARPADAQTALAERDKRVP